jgi:hypothetical protein
MDSKIIIFLLIGMLVLCWLECMHAYKSGKIYDKSIILVVMATRVNVYVHRGNQPSFWLLEIRLLLQEMNMSVNFLTK